MIDYLMIRDDIGATVSYLRLHIPTRNLQLRKICQDLLGSGFVERISMPCSIRHKLTIGSLGNKGGPSDMIYDVLGKSVCMDLGFASHVSTREKRRVCDGDVIVVVVGIV